MKLSFKDIELTKAVVDDLVPRKIGPSNSSSSIDETDKKSLKILIDNFNDKVNFCLSVAIDQPYLNEKLIDFYTSEKYKNSKINNFVNKKNKRKKKNKAVKVQCLIGLV
ncbi:hypothetical protein CDIK_1468 [Cucumispora dikerogammari]|nr:hypothetical protein CDIK_1468 [Cucumispora dikerogammari]